MTTRGSFCVLDYDSTFTFHYGPVVSSTSLELKTQLVKHPSASPQLRSELGRICGITPLFHVILVSCHKHDQLSTWYMFDICTDFCRSVGRSLRARWRACRFVVAHETRFNQQCTRTGASSGALLLLC